MRLNPATPYYQAIVDRITRKLKMNDIPVYQSYDIDNAVATRFGENRRPIIVYNPIFMNNVHNHSQWAMYFVFIHEVAHHYNKDLHGHFLSALHGYDMRSHRKELNADFIAGWILRCEGATLAEASELYNAVTMTASETHPGEYQRRQAMEKGWNEANCKITPKPRVTPPAEKSIGAGEVLVGVGLLALLGMGIAAATKKR